MLLRAAKAKLFDYNKDCDPNFCRAELLNEVFLDFGNNVHLSCQRANIDLTKLNGTLGSHKSPIIYTDLLGQQKVPLEIHGKKGYFEMIKSEEPRFLYPCDLKLLKIFDDVFVKYGNHMTLFAKAAHFQKYSANSARYIKAFGDDTGKAKFVHFKDHVFADEMILDLCTNNISMENIHGSLCSSYFAQKQETSCDVTADHLHWDHKNHLITLNGKISIIDKILGSVDAEDTVKIQEIKQYGHFVIHSITCSGPCQINSFDTLQKEEQSIWCCGKLLFDRDSLSLVASCPKGAKIDQQTLYKNKSLFIYSDFASVDYKLRDMKFAAHSIHFKGSVKILAEDATRPLRFGFANEVTLNPTTQETTLRAKKGEKVLFWNEEENLRISADEIFVSFDEKLKKEKIQGVGNVRFTFNSEEEDNFKEIFPKYIRCK
ncbi:MAG: hypothetical protein S4CHLAM37_13540 [Chlamydiia bacterium]|nr:hypothetical protein [Chlamydiia bacterium]